MVAFVIFQLIGAAFGAAGQRCMALTTAIFVGESKDWIPDVVAKAKELQVNEGNLSLCCKIYSYLDLVRMIFVHVVIKHVPVTNKQLIAMWVPLYASF